jgi:predicted secreted hydrolase
MILRKIDAIIIVVLLVVSMLVLYKAGYIAPMPSPEHSSPQTPPETNTTMPMVLPTPPASLIPSYRRDVSAADEGIHFDDLRVSREWWYFTAMFNDTASSLQNWAVAVSFAHMARGDLFGTNKPDLLVVSLLGNNSEAYGGLINKQHYLGILRQGTLIAETPGVKLQFEDSWAEGSYPGWHLHADSQDIDSSHHIILDLQYQAMSLPVWTYGPRAFNDTGGELDSYVILDCEVTGSITIDGTVFQVKGIGAHEHSWTPHLILRASLKSWDRFSLTLDNGWTIYSTNYQPTLQALTRHDPFSTFLITPDQGSTITELKDVTLSVTQKDEKVFPLVRMPSAFSVEAYPSTNMSYLVSQSLLYGSEMSLSSTIEVTHSTNKIWKFPTYLGMKIGYCTITGTLSWTDDDGTHEMSINGVGVSWSMRALL